MKLKINRFIPTIQVTDLEKAVAYYQKLGFNHDWFWPENGPTHASVSCSSFSFMMVLVDDHSDIQKADLYFVIEGVEAFHKQVEDLSYSPSDLIQSAYGMLDFSIRDPWGHHMVFGEPHGEYVN